MHPWILPFFISFHVNCFLHEPQRAGSVGILRGAGDAGVSCRRTFMFRALAGAIDSDSH